MDTIQFKIVQDSDIYADKAPSPAVAIFINGRSLIDMVREVEVPFAVEEGRECEAGNYVWLRLNWLHGASAHFHGMAESDFYYRSKTNLLECGTCGVSGCWPLLARIEVKKMIVVWKLFEQPYRLKKYASRRVKHWTYDGFGPFRFDREQYETALKPLIEDISAKWVAPFYLSGLLGSDREELRTALAEISLSVVSHLLSVQDWRERIVGSWFAGLKGWSYFEGKIGELLLASEVTYAGAGHCFADNATSFL